MYNRKRDSIYEMIRGGTVLYYQYCDILQFIKDRYFTVRMSHISELTYQYTSVLALHFELLGTPPFCTC